MTGGKAKIRKVISMKTILVIAALDTKGTEIAFCREQIEALGAKALLIDGGDASAEFLKLLEGALAVEERIVLSLDDGHLTLQSENGVGTYDWKLAAEVKNYVGPKKKFCLAFNGRFLVEALKSYPAMLTTLGAPDGYGACLINEKAIVMPIREK